MYDADQSVYFADANLKAAVEASLFVTDPTTADMLGLFRRYKPAFVRRYAELAEMSLENLKKYCEDVRKGTFPSGKESYK